MAVLKAPYRVIFGDTDALGVVYHANYLRMMDMARAEWFREFSIPPLAMFREEEHLIVVVEMHFEHKRPATFDELLSVECWLSRSWVRSASIRFEYQIRHESGELCVRGYTRHAFTRRDGSVKRPPKEFLESLRAVAEDRTYGEEAK
ncbi:MAG: thioesterase family protein [Candidatus Lernaella stagnicola]|nr:thioesterase family protein [Candidatus Lernaella stagnicola]